MLLGCLMYLIHLTHLCNCCVSCVLLFQMIQRQLCLLWQLRDQAGFGRPHLVCPFLVLRGRCSLIGVPWITR